MLVVNRNVEGIRELVKTSREFLGLVFPAVVRQILRFVAREFDVPGQSREWWGLWLLFMKQYAPMPEKIDPDDVAEVEAWIEDAVAAFWTRHNVKNEFRKARLTEGTT